MSLQTVPESSPSPRAADEKGGNGKSSNGESATLAADTAGEAADDASPNVAPPSCGPISGRPVGRQRSTFVGILAALSGYLVLRSLVVVCLRYLLGWKRSEQFFLEEKYIRREHRTELLGRTIREGREYLPYGACVAAGRETRYATAVLVVGLVALIVGVIVGVGLIFDGIRGGLRTMVLSGLGVLLAGVVVDALLIIGSAGGRGRVLVHLGFTGGREYRIVGADRESAGRFLTEVSRQLPRRLDPNA